MALVLAKVLSINKMHRSNQIVIRCTPFAHPIFSRPDVCYPLFAEYLNGTQLKINIL
jgi:hypothetical protein